MIKKEDLISFFYFLIGKINTGNFCKGRPSLLINEIKKMDDEFSKEDLEKIISQFESEESEEGIKEIRSKFINK